MQEATHDFYLGYQEGQARYVGITNDIARRAAEWAGKFDLKKITSCKATRDQARAIEQALINANQDFLNKINSIAPTRDWYNEAINRGQQWLQNNGFQ